NSRAALGIDLLEPVARLVELVVGLDFPAHAVQVGDLVRSEATSDVREIEAVALARNADPDEAYWQVRGADGDVDVHDVAELEIDVVEKEVEIGAGHKRLLEVGAGDALDLRLPAILEADDDRDAVRLTLAQPRDTGVAEIDKQAHAAPALVERQVRRVVL